MLIQKLKNAGKHYLVDTTGSLIASTPIYAAMEVFLSNMNSNTSLNARITITGFAYAGVGLVFTKGRDLSKRIFHITPDKKDSLKKIHDSLYNGAFNSAIGMPVYLISGATTSQAIWGTLGSTALGLVIGPIAGYCVDGFRDFMGTIESERIPRVIKNLGQKTKYALAATSIATSIALTAGVYEIKDTFSTPTNQINLEQKVSTIN